MSLEAMLVPLLASDLTLRSKAGNGNCCHEPG
jgi:hypothetical protein